MPLYRERAVVLRTYRLGETDRIVSLMTETRGKVRAVVKGVRKPGSRFGARLEPTSHVALQLYEGRNLDTVTQAESIDAFRGLRDHLDALTAAMAVLEATDQVAQEQEANGPLYRMVVGALRTLSETPSPLVAPAFLWKLLSLEGFHPQLDACVRCGTEVGLVAVVPEAGGAVCEACAPQSPGAEAGPALALVSRILGGGLRSVLADDGTFADGTGATVREVQRLALRAVEYHFERRLRSGALLTSA
ncbi:MAG TPA: DNA repair protein RecO [Acidimicrobiia bacterium]|nr:DNA repair protein RecO [Acidimicrobiia bacterium]